MPRHRAPASRRRALQEAHDAGEAIYIAADRLGIRRSSAYALMRAQFHDDCAVEDRSEGRMSKRHGDAPSCTRSPRAAK